MTHATPETFRQLERAVATFKAAPLWEKEQAGMVALDLAGLCIADLNRRLESLEGNPDAEPDGA